MNLFQSATLGLVQGFTEFLPISSTAHLRLVPALAGWNDPGAAYSAIIQLGTLLAVILYFRRELWTIVQGSARAVIDPAARKSREAELAVYLIVGTLPVLILGGLLKHQVEGSLRSLWVIAAAMIGLAIVLVFAERTASHVRTMDKLVLSDALIIGLAQSVALIPGASRSGCTLAAALFVGLRRDDAARFSFLLSIPAIAAAGLYQLWKIRHLLADGGIAWEHIVVGTAVAFLSGYAAIAWLLRFLRNRSTFTFVLYRLLLGALLIALLVAGALSPNAGM